MDNCDTPEGNVGKGFLLINSNGEYAREYQVTTHGGQSHRIEWVKSLHRATVFINPALTKKVHGAAEVKSAAILRAESVRTVRIIGGVEE